MGFPDTSADNEPACNAGDPNSIPGVDPSQRVRHDWATKHPHTILYCMHACACMLSHFTCVQLFVNPWTVAHQALPSMGFSGQEYWSGLPCPPPGDLPNPVIKPMSCLLHWQAGSLPLVPPGKPHNHTNICLFTHILMNIWVVPFLLIRERVLYIKCIGIAMDINGITRSYERYMHNF